MSVNRLPDYLEHMQQAIEFINLRVEFRGHEERSTPPPLARQTLGG
jgi:hypothetical protein